MKRLIISKYLQYKANLDDAVVVSTTSSEEEVDESKADDASSTQDTSFEFNFCSSLNEIRNEDLSGQAQKKKEHSLSRKTSN